MAEEVKTPAPPPPPNPSRQNRAVWGPEGEKKPTAEKPAAAESAAPAKPAAPAVSLTFSAKAAAPAKPAVPTPVPWTSPLVDKISQTIRIGLEALTYLGQNYLSVDRSLIPDTFARHARGRAVRLLRRRDGRALSEAGKAIRRDLDPLFFCAQ